MTRARPRSRLRTVSLAASLSAALAGCEGSTGPAPELAGTFELLAYEGQALPVDLGPLPTRTGGISSCHRTVADGALSLDPERRRFALHYSVRSSCDGGILSQSGEIGALRSSGRILRLATTTGEFGGGVGADGRIVVEFFDRTLVFGGPPRTPQGASGRFDLVDLGGGPVEDGGSAPAESGCPTVIDHGTLTLRPERSGAMTGRFDLDYALRSSCTGELRRDAEESGSYEQVAGSLAFVGEVGANIVHPFRGLVDEETIVLFIGTDLVFRAAAPATGG